MRRSTLSAILAGALCIIIAAATETRAQNAFDHAGLARRALEGHVVPAYTRLGEATKALQSALQKTCKAPPRSLPRAAVAAFDEVVKRWGGVEQINFGPAVTGNRSERFLFFPDRRGLGARQVAKALEAQDAALLDPAVLGERSVGLQSLSALDIVLFDPAWRKAAAAAFDYRCRYALSIAANLDRIAQDILAEWSRPDGFRKTWLEPGPGNAVYRTPSETTLALSKALLQGLERVRDERIGAPLGFGKQRVKAPPALGTSGRTLLLVVGNIDGLLDLYRNGGMESTIRGTQPPEAGERLTAMTLLVENEIKTARGIAQGLVATRNPFGDQAAIQRLIAVGYPLKNARDLATGMLVDTAGLTLGFNASDGD